MVKCPNCGYYLPSEKTFFLTPYIGLKCPSCNIKLIMSKESNKRATNQVTKELLIAITLLFLIGIALIIFVGGPPKIVLFIVGLISMLFGFWSYLRNLNTYGIIITEEK